MDYRYILLFALLISSSFGACIGYNDSFDVRVLDAKLRPVEGADVVIKYDRGATFGEQYFITPAKKTDSNGKVHFDILNQGTLSRPIDCKININASLDGTLQKKEIIANTHGQIIDLALSDAYPIKFYVRDQFQSPLKNATVTIGSSSKKTDEMGLVKIFVKKGVYDYFASYVDASQAGKINVSDDTAFEVLFPYYKIQLDVRDDNGNPLNATLMIFNHTYYLADGHFENNKTFGSEVPYTLEYSGLESSGTITPSVEPNVKAVFDVHAPLFGEIKPEVLNNRPKLHIIASDPGKLASGISISSIKVTYKIEPGDSGWSNAITFTAGLNKFTTDFPELPENSIVNFKIEVKDNAGNKADIDGKFSTLIQQNNTQNQTNTQTEPPQEQGIPLLYILIGVIIVILTIYMVFRIRSKASGGS